MDVVSVTLVDDLSGTQTNTLVDASLAELFSYAHQWAVQENRRD